MMTDATTDHIRAWFLVGPTAVGKTDVAVALAEKVGAEIISADSRQFYQGMEIGTAAPDAVHSSASRITSSASPHRPSIGVPGGSRVRPPPSCAV